MCDETVPKNKQEVASGVIADADRYEPKFIALEDATVLDVPDVVALEQAIAAQGTSLATLMDRAGASIAQVVREEAAQPCHVVALCGTGNNGGDGWVAADLLAEVGYRATIVTPREAESVKTEPAHSAAMRTTKSQRADIVVTADEQELDAVLSDADVVIDAVLGTGFSSDELHGSAASYVAALGRMRERGGQRKVLVVAADVPSGLSAQTGRAADLVVRADVTVTMIVAKPGLLSDEGRMLCGRIVVADIA